jgi:hypothetical protein
VVVMMVMRHDWLHQKEDYLDVCLMAKLGRSAMQAVGRDHRGSKVRMNGENKGRKFYIA